MRSPTNSEGSRLVRIVVPCAQTRVPWPRGHRDAFSNERRKGPRVSRRLLSRPPSLEWSKRRGLFFVIVWWYIRRERMSPFTRWVRAAAWPAMRGVVYTIMAQLSSAHAHCTNWQLIVRILSMLLVYHSSCHGTILHQQNKCKILSI